MYVIRPDGAAPRDLAALVEPLGDLHGAADREAETPRRGLLELRGDEGRRAGSCGARRSRPTRRVQAAFSRRPRRPASPPPRPPAADPSPSNLSFSPSKDDEPRRELRRDLARELRVDRPVLDRDEGLDLVLALADDPKRHRLDPPGGESPPDLLPEQVRDLVSDEAVDDAAGLLGVDAAAVDLAGRFHRREHGLLGDLVEAHAAERRLAGAGLQRLLQVPGDRFALAVRVGGEIDGVRGLGRALELVDRLLLAGEDLVGRLVGVLAVDAEPLARQIAHVPVRGHDLEALAEELLEGLGLRGGLDDDDGLGHTGRGPSHNTGERANRGCLMSRNKSSIPEGRSGALRVES